jgi:hypothetical protein
MEGREACKQAAELVFRGVVEVVVGHRCNLNELERNEHDDYLGNEVVGLSVFGLE